MRLCQLLERISTDILSPKSGTQGNAAFETNGACLKNGLIQHYFLGAAQEMAMLRRKIPGFCFKQNA